MDPARCRRPRAVDAAGGLFQCRVPANVALTATARHAAYLPIAAALPTVAVLDTLELTISLAPLAVGLDTVRTRDTAPEDTVHRGLFSVTPGRLVFQKHMQLGKGHFISGFDIQRSGLLLSEYLSHLDSLQLVSGPGMGIPVIPAGKGKFLTSTVQGHCLYGRINYWNIGSLLLQQQRSNIDQLLTLDEVVGVEVYLNYHDVPAEWRADAFPATVHVFPCPNQPGGTWFWMGDVGLQGGGARCVPPPGGQPPRVPLTTPPTCPFVQIWTRLSW